MRILKLLRLICLAGLVCAPATALGQSVSAEVSSPTRSVWQGELGDGFKAGAEEIHVSAGIGLGMQILGSMHSHHWGLATVQYGWMLSDVVCEDRWCRGNFEFVAELFGGYQFHPEGAYLSGITPLVRYNFAPGGRWVPFIDAGAGATMTDIRDGDLSTPFEFNLQLGLGTHMFLREDLALTFQYRFIHLSNAGIEAPNLGVNNSTILFGVTWFL